MGVTLNGELIPSRIDPDEWASFYEDSLKIIEAGQLAERGWIDIDGIKCMCLVPTRSQEGCWCVAGDLITGLNMEAFELQNDLTAYMSTKSEGNGQDVVYALDYNDEYTDLQPKTTWFFNGKTQGHRAHMYLLCILCLATHRFPDAVALSGCITAGQCMRAQKMVKDILGEDISLPVQFDSIALYKHIESLHPQDEAMRFELFFQFYCGLQEQDYRDFLKEHFSLDSMYKYFLKKNRSCKKISKIVRQWLELELPLDKLCSLVKELGKTSSDLIAALVDGKVHVEHKVTYDASVVYPWMDKPDDIKTQLTRVFMKIDGLGNPNINAYIPEEDIVKTLQAAFPEDPISDSWAKALASDAARPVEEGSARYFYDNLKEDMNKTPPPQQYDIDTEEDLYFWVPGDTMDPELEASLLANLRAIFEQEDILWEALKGMNKTQRFQAYILAMQPYNYFPLLTVSVLKDMYDHVMDEHQGKHDWALVNTSVKYDIVYDFVNLMGLNRGLFLYLCQKIDTADNGIEKADS